MDAYSKAAYGRFLDHGYFSSGVMLLNLKRMREETLFSRVTAIASLLDTDPPFPEQDALNLACDGSWLELHPKWNTYASLYFHGDAGSNTWPSLTLNEAVTSPAILHFESPIIFRPWSVRCIHPHRALYRWYRNRTPWPLPAPESSGLKDRVYSLLPVPLRLSLLRRRVRFTRRRQSLPAANPGRRFSLTLRYSAKRSLAVVFGWLQRFGVDLLPRHFYSSIPDIRQLRSEPRWRAPRTFVGVQGSDVAEQLRFLGSLITPDVARRLRSGDVYRDACSENGAPGYGPVEADVLYAFVRSLRPSKIVQVGAGVSTAVILTAAREAGYTPASRGRRSLPDRVSSRRARDTDRTRGPRRPA